MKRPSTLRQALRAGLLRGVVVWALFSVGYLVPTLLVVPLLTVRWP